MSSAKIGFVSLGCPKNLVDSERILTQLKREGYQVSDTYEAADAVIINTCGFIDSAIEESLETIGEAISRNGNVIVTGCLGKNAELIRQTHPQVLAISGAHEMQATLDAVHQIVAKPDEALARLMPKQGVKLTPDHYAYLKISEGCNHHCRFCIIPQLRGKLDSYPAGKLLTEAERLVEAGVRELLVVSQDTSAYGLDKKYRTDFWQGRPIKTQITALARELGDLEAWIRLMYVYPYPHVSELIPLMAEGAILPYLDMPLQHGSSKILKAMQRPAATEKVLDRISQWRKDCPNLTLRSTFIVGFPDETEADFQELLDFIDEAQLDRVGCFTYSPVAGATANELKNPVDEEVKQQRLKIFMEKQAEISAKKLQNKISTTEIILIDEVSPEAIIGRTQGDAPEIDGNVIIAPEWDLSPGDFIEVKITDADQHDLYAEPIDYQ